MNEQAYKGLDRIFRPIQSLVGITGFVGGIILCSMAAGDSLNIGPVVPFALLMSLGFATTIIHELGHYAAAKLFGMTVVRIRVGRIEIVPQRHGWRIRWNTQQKIQVSGFVAAACNDRRAMPPQMLFMAAGGPVANLLTALLSAGIVLLVSSNTGWLIGTTFALLNTTAGVANLLPTSRGIGSDGLRLLVWGQKEFENSPTLVTTRLIALSISGVTADHLPVDLIAALDSQAMPAPFSALWFRLKAHQNRGEWLQASKLQNTYDQLMERLPEPGRAAYAATCTQMRTELAFSLAMVSGEAGHLKDDLLPKQDAWSIPSLWPRCLALRAFLAGDNDTAEKLLDDVQRIADRSLDRALAKSEALMQGHLLAAMAVGSVK